MQHETRIKRTSSEQSRRSGVAEIVGTTDDIDLVQPINGATTQRDANVDFNERIIELETVIDSGTFP